MNLKLCDQPLGSHLARPRDSRASLTGSLDEIEKLRSKKLVEAKAKENKAAQGACRGEGLGSERRTVQLRPISSAERSY